MAISGFGTGSIDMIKQFEKVKSNHRVPKEFSYSKGVCSLKFTLRIDVKNELKDFLECLQVAQKEVEEEINK